MKNKILLFVVLILSFIAVKSSFQEKETTFSNEQKVTILDQEKNEKNTLNLEEYIIGVVAAEMPASFNEEALKAQAVAARTYAMYKINTSNKDYDLVTDVTNQSYLTTSEMQEKWQEDYEFYYQKIKEAVKETKEEVMTYENEVICAFYFAMSNGYTEEAALVFGNNEEYLESVDSSWDKNVNNFEVINKISKTTFCEKLNIECSNIKIGKIERSKTNRVNSIEINNKKFKGTDFRHILELRSTDFTIEINEDVVITTKGYGHGVGMSQYGANEMAKLGKDYTEILNYYYKDIEIEKINV